MGCQLLVVVVQVKVQNATKQVAPASYSTSMLQGGRELKLKTQAATAKAQDSSYIQATAAAACSLLLASANSGNSFVADNTLGVHVDIHPVHITINTSIAYTSATSTDHKDLVRSQLVTLRLHLLFFGESVP